jgi:parallel beta-helix repeat protein
VGIYVNRTNHFRLSGNRLDKNSGSGIRHYEAKHGVLQGNVVLNHFGMHSSGLNFYEGCSDIVFEGNYVHNTIAINRNAERLTFRNNVIDGLGRSAVSVAMWTSGSVGGREIKDIQFINNTFVNLNPNVAWATGILGQRAGSPSAPQGLIIRNNILHGLAEDISGKIENNIYIREVEKPYLGTGSQVISDLRVLFRDPARGDYRRKPGGPAMDVGATIPPPPPMQQRAGLAQGAWLATHRLQSCAGNHPRARTAREHWRDTARHALNVLALAAPDWLLQHAQPAARPWVA